MGLVISHGCWHGPYSAFMRFRIAVAKAAGIPDLMAMDGYGGETKWNESDPLTILFLHSDCEGIIASKDCEPLAKRLEEVMGLYTQRFIAGLRDAASKGEDIEFH